jgi:hypothetical protein
MKRSGRFLINLIKLNLLVIPAIFLILFPSCFAQNIETDVTCITYCDVIETDPAIDPDTITVCYPDSCSYGCASGWSDCNGDGTCECTGECDESGNCLSRPLGCEYGTDDCNGDGFCDCMGTCNQGVCSPCSEGTDDCNGDGTCDCVGICDQGRCYTQKYCIEIGYACDPTVNNCCFGRCEYMMSGAYWCIGQCQPTGGACYSNDVCCSGCCYGGNCMLSYYCA